MAASLMESTLGRRSANSDIPCESTWDQKLPPKNYSASFGIPRSFSVAYSGVKYASGGSYTG